MDTHIAGKLLASLTLAVAAGASAQAQIPADPYDYSRSTSFVYQSNGRLDRETVEPDNTALCVDTIHAYDDYGNRQSSYTGNCYGATGLSQFKARTDKSALYDPQSVTIAGVSATVSKGLFATRVTNALNQSEDRTYDPRFGAALTLRGPNGLTTEWQLDAHGRKVLEKRADGTKTGMYYCWLTKSFNGVVIDTSSNSPQCHNGIAPDARLVPTPAANEAPADAVRYEHSVALGTNDAPITAFVRLYYDRAGRKIRSVTQAFDVTTQPGGTDRLIVQDTDYNQYGAAQVTTQPYFLDTGSSLASGTSTYGMALTEYDALGRPTAVFTTDPTATGQVGGSVASKSFGNRGVRQAARTTFEYRGLTTVTVNDKGQPRTEEKNPEGLLVRITDASGSNAANGAQLVHQHDAFGQLVATKDALGNITRITYDIRGRKIVLNDPDAGVTAYCYDALGQLKAQQSSNQRGGSHTPGTCPAAAITETTAPTVAGWTTQAHDVLGRLTQRVQPEYVSNWAYDSCTMGVGKLCTSGTNHGVSRRFAYDGLGRPSSSRTELTGDPSFASTLSYDATTGRVQSQTYPSGVKISYQYTSRGFLRTVQNDTSMTLNPLPAAAGGAPGASTTVAAGTVLWQALAANAWGKTEQQSFANGVNSRAVFEAQSGRLTNLSAGPTTTNSVVDQRYRWDNTGLLTQRIDAIGDAAQPAVAIADDIQHDSLGRIKQYQVSGNGTPSSRTVTLEYNALGMLLYKSDVGNYSYPVQGVANGRPHAVQSIAGAYNANYQYDNNGNATSADAGKWRGIAYTSFNLPDGNQGIQGPADGPRNTWMYDENQQRIKDMRVNASGTRTTWNLHPDNAGGLGFEHELATDGTRSNRHYLSAGGAAFAVLVTRGAMPTLDAAQTAPTALASVAAVKLEYWHKDHLGSLIASTDHTGAVTERYAYDPFGKRRFTNATYDAFGALVIDWTTDTNKGTDRGFTGHEHLDELGLIHMNGRIFDPTTARFTQADPLIQDPGNLQNFDRYQYCFNSPLGCTDPSGLSAWTSFRDGFIRGAAAAADYFGCAGACSSAVAYYQASRNGGGDHSGLVAAINAYIGYQIGGDTGLFGFNLIAACAQGDATRGGSCRGGVKAFLVEQTATYAFGSFVGSAAGGCYSARQANRSCGAGARDGFAGAAGSYAGQQAGQYAYEQYQGYVRAQVWQELQEQQGPVWENWQACDGCPAPAGVSANRAAGLAFERAVAEQIEAAGYALARNVELKFTTAAGEVVTAIADYVYLRDGTIVVGEVKWGPNAKFSVAQKSVYDAIVAGKNVAIDPAALKLAGISDEVHKVAVRQFELRVSEAAGRASRQALARWGLTAIKGVGVVLTLPVQAAVELLLYSPEAK
jgi:RHS repeat-associated protein